MIPPDPAFLYRAGLRNLLDLAILWHLAQCGVTGSKVETLAQTLRIPLGTVRSSIDRLHKMRYLTNAIRLEVPGSPCIWSLSRYGFRLMTGHLTDRKLAQASAPEIVHAT